jgi:hypothetical protein
VLRTDEMGVQQAVAAVLEALAERGVVPRSFLGAR